MDERSLHRYLCDQGLVATGSRLVRTDAGYTVNELQWGMSRLDVVLCGERVEAAMHEYAGSDVVTLLMFATPEALASSLDASEVTLKDLLHRDVLAVHEVAALMDTRYPRTMHRLPLSGDELGDRIKLLEYIETRWAGTPGAHGFHGVASIRHFVCDANFATLGAGYIRDVYMPLRTQGAKTEQCALLTKEGDALDVIVFAA